MCDYVSGSVVTIIYSIRIDTKTITRQHRRGSFRGACSVCCFAGACTNIALKSLLANLISQKKKIFFF